MRTQDVMKLASNLKFKILRANKIKDEEYLLKEFQIEGCPSWEIISPSCTYGEVFNYCQAYKKKGKYPLLCSQKLTTFDLLEISKNGFRIIQEEEGDNGSFDVIEFQAETLSWKIIESFCFISERNKFLNFQLLNPCIICV